MAKHSKKSRIKELEYAISTLFALFNDATDVESDAKIIKLTPFSEFQKQLRETEAKYALKVS